MSSTPVGGMPVYIVSGNPEVADREGMVLVRYADTLVAMDSEFARLLSEKLARVSYKVRFGDYPTPQKSAQGDAVRTRLTRRVELMLGSFDRAAPRPEAKVQASAIVDECLREMT